MTTGIALLTCCQRTQCTACTAEVATTLCPEHSLHEQLQAFHDHLSHVLQVFQQLQTNDMLKMLRHEVRPAGPVFGTHKLCYRCAAYGSGHKSLQVKAKNANKKQHCAFCLCLHDQQNPFSLKFIKFQIEHRCLC